MVEGLKEGNRFSVHWSFWTFLGTNPPEHYRAVYFVYSVIFNILLIIGYPLSLTIGLFQTSTTYDMFNNLGISLPGITCMIKFYLICWQLDKARVMQKILVFAEKRISTPEETSYYIKSVLPAAKRILYIFYFTNFGIPLAGEIGVLIGGVLEGDWRLMYPAYFPFDIERSSLNYAVAHIFQAAGVFLLGFENICNDTYGAMNLAVLCGHVHMLGMRVSFIGQDSKKTPAENNSELIKCIHDYKRILQYRDVLENIYSLCAFIQFAASCVSMCIGIIFMIFFASDFVEYIYYSMYIFAIPMEIFPLCYYGKMFEWEMESLTYCLFKCNWMEQDKKFNSHLRTFTELSLKKRSLKAGGMVDINFSSFMAMCKMAYSLFALVIQMK